MFDLIMELTLVSLLFLWFHRRQVRARERDRRVPPAQMRFDLDD